MFNVDKLKNSVINGYKLKKEDALSLIDAPLDELDPTFGAPYTLNVSSLGADRPFKTDADFLSHIGKRVEVKLINGIKGKKFYDGELASYDGKIITLKVDSKNTFTIDLKNTVKVNEYIDFE
jgi:ribosome maturation factor RimP